MVQYVDCNNLNSSIPQPKLIWAIEQQDDLISMYTLFMYVYVRMSSNIIYNCTFEMKFVIEECPFWMTRPFKSEQRLKQQWRRIMISSQTTISA